MPRYILEVYCYGSKWGLITHFGLRHHFVISHFVIDNFHCMYAFMHVSLSLGIHQSPPPHIATLDQILVYSRVFINQHIHDEYSSFKHALPAITFSYSNNAFLTIFRFFSQAYLPTVALKTTMYSMTPVYFARLTLFRSGALCSRCSQYWCVCRMSAVAPLIVL